ncbi:hypothetical protein GH714_033626 [Hevea brasiliensis]|uniref:Uncharacterized protein n=1 Tax=Hevea brasiliensis TaxID=3981 RepID=A0A6A6N6X0_HEVBR|nr:hypothetical protein GH714_033626 [Hevea brasiliensis]
MGYYDGKTWTVHGLTWDTMSMVRIDRMCQGLKIEGMLRYFWRQPWINKLRLKRTSLKGSQEFHVQGTFDDLGSSNIERFNGISNACTYEFGQASYSGFANFFFNMNEDTITDNDYLHTSANGDDIGEDIIRHDNESQIPNAKDDGIGQRVGNKSEVKSQHDTDVRNDNERQIPNVEDDGTGQTFGSSKCI